MISTWSSSVKLPIKFLYLVLCASKGPTVYVDDTCDAYACSPTPKTVTHLTIGDVYFKEYKDKTDLSLNQRHVLLVLYSFQFHLEFRKIWTRLIDRILIEDLGFKTTTADRCIFYEEDR